ncbi:MAG: NAD(+)/NADH kinase [Spirochaetaceae bacterium]|nr:NAD(+)/NADH kinase [Spirochaetaceae bacterium]
MKALLIINPQKAASFALAGEINAVLESKAVEVSAFSYTDHAPPSLDFDIILSLGGDGTVLFSARTAAERGIPVLPVNLGTLGFIATVAPENWEEAFEKWRAGNSVISERVMLDVRLERAGKSVFFERALNDAVISSSGIAKTIRLSAKTKGLSLAQYRSDGLVVATPTGSTGYSASAGGPVLDPEMEAVIISPICPFSQFQRPLVLPADEALFISVEPEQQSEIMLTIDGQISEALETGDVVQIRKADRKASLIAAGRKAYYKALHTKRGR